MLRIGNNKKGFTLVEVMVATAVLSLSMVLVYQAFFISLDSFNYCADYLELIPLADEKLWQAEDALTRSSNLNGIDQAGEFASRGKLFSWALSNEILDPTGPLYKINIEVIWRQGKRDVKLSRAVYAIYEKKE